MLEMVGGGGMAEPLSSLLLSPETAAAAAAADTRDDDGMMTEPCSSTVSAVPKASCAFRRRPRRGRMIGYESAPDGG